MSPRTLSLSLSPSLCRIGTDRMIRLLPARRPLSEAPPDEVGILQTQLSRLPVNAFGSSRHGLCGETHPHPAPQPSTAFRTRIASSQPMAPCSSGASHFRRRKNQRNERSKYLRVISIKSKFASAIRLRRGRDDDCTWHQAPGTHTFVSIHFRPFRRPANTPLAPSSKYFRREAIAIRKKCH